MPKSVMDILHLYRTLIARDGVIAGSRLLARLYVAKWLADRGETHAYKEISPSELLSTKRSSKVFVFGSGYSLNEITSLQWKHISNHNTLGFNYFVRQNWVRTDYHLIRGWGEGAGAKFDWQRACSELSQLINNNPFYANTILIVQNEITCEVGNRILAGGFLNSRRTVYRYTTRRNSDLPTTRLEDGLVHGNGTLCDAVNFAAAMGWTEIVLVGVDLYDTRYFFLPPNRTLNTDYRTGQARVAEISDRGQRWDQPHSTFTNGAVALFGRWTDELSTRGMRLSVWNPRSLLRAVMPVYVPEEAPCPNTTPRI